MSKFTVIYDACVLYPAPLRDFLMYLALQDLYRARWTEDIHEEWIHALLKARPDLTREKLQRTRELMDRNVLGALVTDYEKFIPIVELPDPSDRHVVAAAIRCGADAIVTFNEKDFPADALAAFEVEVLHPDEFVVNQAHLSEGAVLAAAKEHREALRNPRKSAEEYLDTLRAQRLPKTAAYLSKFQSVL